MDGGEGRMRCSMYGVRRRTHVLRSASRSMTGAEHSRSSKAALTRVRT